MILNFDFSITALLVATGNYCNEEWCRFSKFYKEMKEYYSQDQIS